MVQVSVPDYVVGSFRHKNLLFTGSEKHNRLSVEKVPTIFKIVIGFKLFLLSGLVDDIIYYKVKVLSTRELRFLKSEYGGEWLRPDGGWSSRMPRTPVGLANHPAKLVIGNSQLRMAA
jgi:hypothetical protein